MTTQTQNKQISLNGTGIVVDIKAGMVATVSQNGPVITVETSRTAWSRLWSVEDFENWCGVNGLALCFDAVDGRWIVI